METDQIISFVDEGTGAVAAFVLLGREVTRDVTVEVLLRDERRAARDAFEILLKKASLCDDRQLQFDGNASVEQHSKISIKFSSVTFSRTNKKEVTNL